MILLFSYSVKNVLFLARLFMYSFYGITKLKFILNIYV